MPTNRSQCVSRRMAANELYEQANERWTRGRRREAFRLFLAAARAGNDLAFETIAQFYDFGCGTKTNRPAALYWYRRAYRNGSDSAANNIGCIWRDRGETTRALAWFRRAVELGDADANLNIAKLYLRRGTNLAKAKAYLDKVRKSKRVTAGSIEEAQQLLKRLSRAR